jgi:hypothetical protein
MIFEEIVELIGKPIRSEEIGRFFETNGFKYPKRDTISGSAGDWNFWVENKKAGVNFLFSIDIKNAKYDLIQAERKGIFVPLLSNISFGEKADIIYPFGIGYDATLSELEKKLEKEMPPSKHFPDWLVRYALIEERRDIVFYAKYDMELQKIRALWVRINEDDPVMQLYYPQQGEDVKSLVKTALEDFSAKPYPKEDPAIRNFNRALEIACYIKSKLFFIYWAVENDFLTIGTKEEREALKLDKIDVVDFVGKAFREKYYVVAEDFTGVDKDFIYNYLHNSESYYYVADFERAFAFDEIAEYYVKKYMKITKLKYSKENHKIVADFIDKQMKEFHARKLAKGEK